jgi:hypothetical protein
VQGRCWEPHGLRRGKEGFFGLSEYPLRCDYRLRRSAQGIKSCARDSNEIASIDGSKDRGRASMATTLVIDSPHDVCKS